MFFKKQDESYTMINLYLYDRLFVYKKSYNYCDIVADKILLFKESGGKYFIRCNDVYYTKIITLKLRIDNFYGGICIYANNNRVMYIQIDDKELFRKCRAIWNKITELIGINNTENFVKTTEDNGDKYIEVDLIKIQAFFLYCIEAGTKRT